MGVGFEGAESFLKGKFTQKGKLAHDLLTRNLVILVDKVLNMYIFKHERY